MRGWSSAQGSRLDGNGSQSRIVRDMEGTPLFCPDKVNIEEATHLTTIQEPFAAIDARGRVVLRAIHKLQGRLMPMLRHGFLSCLK